ncbi:hypothetical protein GUJ93_ZPchr0006g42731 [Zizania palustris]|uniref:Uncharacterized protein n=1 Tax=Zizania palustris TaxID=103762 RepID=A0A8J5SDY6_ZIZPA|nr:hypothetical protein GUJ93_ZPchr0006g42731 [Zizania palustris]
MDVLQADHDGAARHHRSREWRGGMALDGNRVVRRDTGGRWAGGVVHWCSGTLAGWGDGGMALRWRHKSRKIARDNGQPGKGPRVAA